MGCDAGVPRFLLLFPPGWTFHSGGPHLALPMLRAVLEQRGVEVRVRDLNIEVGLWLKARVENEKVMDACQTGTMAAYNHVYFASQGVLEEAAKPYGARWDVRLGFEYEDLSSFSSQDSLQAARRESPFTRFYQEGALAEILDLRPNVIALELACIQQMVPALQLCRMLRDAGCGATIIAGGNTVTRLADSLANPALFDLVDAFALYQGEPTVFALADALASPKPLAGVPNIIWRDGEEIRRIPTDNRVDSDAAPVPNFDDLPLEEYWGEPYLPLLSARGCYHGRCSFCAIPLGWGERQFAGMRSPELVFQDIAFCAEKYGITNFKFVDEAMPPRTIKYLATRLLREGLKVQWEAYTRLEQAWVDSDLADVAAAGGFRKGYFGVEILEGRNREVLNKKDAANAADLIRRCKGTGVLVHMFSMLGYPGTTPADARRTVEFALSKSDSIDTLDVFAYGYARGTSEPPGVKLRRDPRLDWALEIPFESAQDGVTSSAEIDAMVEFYEEFVFAQQPRLLHPTYRLMSPWHMPSAGRSASV